MPASTNLKQQLIGQLRAWIFDQGLTQKQAAKALGVPQSTVSALERFALAALLDLWEKIGGECQITLVRPESRGEPPHKPSCKRWNGKYGWKESQPCTCGALGILVGSS